MPGPLGKVALVMVGAGGVGVDLAARRCAPDRLTTTAPPGAARTSHAGSSYPACASAAAMSAFRLGSTVVMIFEPRTTELFGEPGDAVQFGRAIGRSGGAA